MLAVLCAAASLGASATSAGDGNPVDASNWVHEKRAMEQQMKIMEQAQRITLLEVHMASIKEASAKDKELADTKNTILEHRLVALEKRLSEVEKQPIQAAVETSGSPAPPLGRRLSESSGVQSSGVSFTPETGFDAGVSGPPTIYTNASGGLFLAAKSFVLSLESVSALQTSVADLQTTVLAALLPSESHNYELITIKWDAYFSLVTPNHVGLSVESGIDEVPGAGCYNPSFAPLTDNLARLNCRLYCLANAVNPADCQFMFVYYITVSDNPARCCPKKITTDDIENAQTRDTSSTGESYLIH